MMRIAGRSNIRSNPRRRTAIASTICGCAALALSVGAQAQERITVTTYTGVWDAAQRACIIDPFNKSGAGIQAVAESGLSSVTYAKLRQQKDRPEVDVAWIDGGLSEQAWADGLIDEIDPQKIPNLSEMVPQGIYKTKDGKIHALSTGFYSTAILYNTQEIKQKPTSWWDLWKPEFANRVISPSPAQAIFMPLFLHINNLLGGSSTNFDPALEKFRSLKAASFYDATGVAQNSVQSGEVIIGAYYANAAWALTDRGVPVAAAVPKEGVPAGDIRVQLVKNTSHKAAAEKFINFAVSADALNCIGEKLYLGPPLKTPKLSDNAKGRMPWGPEGSVSNLVIPDWNEVNAIRAQVTELWNRRVVAR